MSIEPATLPKLSLSYPLMPPQSLGNRVHEAYTLDNIYLTKILYLQVLGICVVGNSGPRVERVREEDFPFGTLILDEDDERTLKGHLG